MTRTIRTAALGAAAMLAVAAPIAMPHAELTKTNPKAGSTVKKLPKVITLTFGEAIGKAFPATVKHDGMNHASRTRVNPRNRKQVQIFTSGSMDATYRVTWRVVSADGHAVRGSFRFTVKSS
ncbi:MAG: copper resistance protein CopC [Thermoleophilia bacterium]